MAANLIGSASGGPAPTTPQTTYPLNVGGAVRIGDVLVVSLRERRGDASFVTWTLSGWTLLGNASDTTAGFGWLWRNTYYWRRVTSLSESYSAVASANCYCEWTVWTVRGVKTGTSPSLQSTVATVPAVANSPITSHTVTGRKLGGLVLVDAAVKVAQLGESAGINYNYVTGQPLPVTSQQSLFLSDADAYYPDTAIVNIQHGAVSVQSNWNGQITYVAGGFNYYVDMGTFISPIESRSIFATITLQPKTFPWLFSATQF